MYSDKVAETPMWFVADRGNLRGVGGARSTDVSYGRTGLQGRMKHPMTREHVNTWRIGATRATLAERVQNPKEELLVDVRRDARRGYYRRMPGPDSGGLPVPVRTHAQM